MPADRDGLLKTARASGVLDAMLLAVLTLIGIAYFSQYYNAGFNLADEGSVVLTSARLLEGETPYLGIELGYGLLWFYPLVALFQVTGVSFVAIRIFFCGLAILTAWLAFLTLRKQTGRRDLAAVVALVVLIVPGTLHKVYIPLIVIANMFCLPRLGRHRPIPSTAEVFVAGLVAAASYHIRPDLGLGAVLVLALALVLQAVIGPQTWSQRGYQLGRTGLLLGAAFLILTLPLVRIAFHDGFLHLYWDLLYQPVNFLSQWLTTFFGSLVEGLRSVILVQVAWASPAPAVAPEIPVEAGKTLARTPLTAAWSEGPGRDLALLTYLPLLFLALVAGLACFLLFRQGLRQRMLDGDTAEILALAGIAFSAFPQFFLFRPDVAHVSQFMPGFLVLAGVCFGRWLYPTPGAMREVARGPASKRRFGTWGRALAAGLLVLYVAFYVSIGLRNASAGSIALARWRTKAFVGANGVEVNLTTKEKNFYTAVTRTVEAHSGVDDFVLCFPYCPGLNVVTQRKTFMRRLYVDDGMLRLDPFWQQRMIARIETEQVPLIIIQDWAINRTEISRFQNWASVLMEHIMAGYELEETLGTFAFYVRKSQWQPTSALSKTALESTGGEKAP
ncbi:MAG: hypothetical protein AAF657_21560 [Acidobacteriota bacterium]